jgi:hypothetical protein
LTHALNCRPEQIAIEEDIQLAPRKLAEELAKKANSTSTSTST